MDGYDVMAYSPIVNGEIVLDFYFRTRLWAGLGSSIGFGVVLERPLLVNNICEIRYTLYVSSMSVLLE